MAHTFYLRTKRQQIGYVFGILRLYMSLFLCLFACLSVQKSVAAERWQIVVLPDTNDNTQNELPVFTDLHSTISQGLTNALTHADFDVINLHYLSLPNCILEDCSTLSDQAIRQAAIRSGKKISLALLYRLNAFKQRQGGTQRWYFNLYGRLLDLQNGTQQDAFTVDNWVNSPAKNCIGDCLIMWVNQNLELLAQDLGTVLSEKLNALPRRFHYALNLNNFNSTELQKIDSYLKNIKGYVADILLTDSQNKNEILNQDTHQTMNETHDEIRNEKPNLNTNRTYQYISELTASALSVQLEKLNQHYAAPLNFEYDNTQRRFTLIRTTQTDSWDTLRQFITELFPDSAQRNTPALSSEVPSTLIGSPQTEQAETDEDKEIRRDQQMWQQANGIDTQDSYQQYLKIWPQGQHFIQAKAAIKAFRDDRNSWQQASDKYTHQAFQQYLALRPNGKYRYHAKQQLTLLRERQQLEQKKSENKTLADNYYQQHNYPEAIYYFEQAAKLGDTSSLYLLGKMYEDAKGTEKNLSQAANWYTQAAKKGHRKAQVTLGFMYSKGYGVSQDYSQAVNWYLKAAEQGDIDAQHNLAYLYSNGQGVVKDYQQAAFWYQKSAIQGDDDAQNSLGKFYERGLGVTKNLAKAKSLYQQAAAQGNQIAQLNLKMLKK